jgi:hypothetical protein
MDRDHSTRSADTERPSAGARRLTQRELVEMSLLRKPFKAGKPLAARDARGGIFR